MTKLLYIVFLTASWFTTLLDLFISAVTVFNLPTSILPNSAFKLAKSDFSAKFDVLSPASPF